MEHRRREEAAQTIISPAAPAQALSDTTREAIDFCSKLDHEDSTRAKELSW